MIRSGAIRSISAREARARVIVRACTCALLAVAPALPAQMVPTGFSASVQVDSASYHGDTLYVAHTASNAPGSPGPLWGFVLETPAPVARQVQPSTGDWLLNLGVFGGRQTAQWIGLGAAKARPGQHMPSLSVGAVGIPDVVSYWVIAFTPPRQSDDPDREPEINPMLQRSIRGTTVGIVPVPTAATPSSLTTRLRRLLGRACDELGWITQQGVCRSLDVKLGRAQEAFAAGQSTTGRNELTAFLTELDSQHGAEPGKHVNDAAYALLAANARYLLVHDAATPKQ
jgi:hypothetical protein